MHNYTTTAVALFWSKVQKTQTCWLWKGFITTPGGYGRVTITVDRVSKTVGAHRMSYELMVGDIPSGLTIDHLCRVKNCVNPSHLETVTQSENSKRAWANADYRKVVRRKEFCKRGHSMSGENVYNCPDGSRQCRACNKIHTTAHRQTSIWKEYKKQWRQNRRDRGDRVC